MKSILLIIAHQGFQPVEYGAPKKILETAGIEVVTASDSAESPAVSSAGSQLVDIALSAVKPTGYDGIVVIGGPGALEHLDNEQTHNIMHQAAEHCSVWGAICISPRILAHAGLLRDKKATGWNGDGELEDILRSAGATYLRQPVVIDGNLITAEGPSVAKEFGEAIVRKFQSA